MNAHTLANLLDGVPGVTFHGPWQFVGNSSVKIQGPDIRHVTVLMNGVPINKVTDHVTVVGIIPVLDIEKVEIVKGPASSAWGSAMGGVINIIPKGLGNKAVRGTVSLDDGKENTGDYRAAISGRMGRFGCSLSGTKLKTDGLTEGFDVAAGSLGARIDYAIAEQTSANFTLFYGDTSRGEGILDLRHRSVRPSRPLSGRHGPKTFVMNQLIDDLELSRATFRENRSGASLEYSSNHRDQNMVFGADCSTGTLDASTNEGDDPEFKQWALFANDTIKAGNPTITPGIRYDDFSTTDSFWSPSLGMT